VTRVLHVAVNDVPGATIGALPATSVFTGATIGSMHTNE
jgi:hypothetical protein